MPLPLDLLQGKWLYYLLAVAVHRIDLQETEQGILVYGCLPAPVDLRTAKSDGISPARQSGMDVE